jgi:tetratricopeptide (TPR) repeat protein
MHIGAAILAAAVITSALPAHAQAPFGCARGGPNPAEPPCTTETATPSQKAEIAREYVAHGNRLLDNGNWLVAQIYYNNALLWDASSADAYNGLGNIQRMNGDLVRALADFEKAVALAPHTTAFLYMRGTTLRDMGRSDRAIQDFDKVIAIDPKAAIAYINRGLAHADKGDLRTALADYTKAIALDPKIPRAYYNRGLALHDSGLHDEALRDYSVAIDLDPRFVAAYINRAQIHAGYRRRDAAIADLRRALQLAPEADVLRDRLKQLGADP